MPDNLRAHSWSYECSTTTCPGFDVLQGLLIRYSYLPQVCEALAVLLLGKKASHTAEGEVSPFSPYISSSSSSMLQHFIACPLQVRLDDILQSLIDSQADTPAQQLCVEAVTILLELVKVIITRVRM